MNNKPYETAQEILTYLNGNRQIGHTTAVIRGALNTPNCLVVIHNKAFGSDILAGLSPKNIDTISLQEILNGRLRGMKTPLLIDNAALTVLLAGLVSSITVLRKNNAGLERKIVHAKAALNAEYDSFGI